MQNDRYTESVQSDDLNLTEIFSALWAGKKVIIAVTSVFALTSVIYALTLVDEYKATAIITPSQSGSSSMLGSMASQFGGLASLAGINIGSDGGGLESQQAIEIMSSQAFIVDFIRENNLEVAIYAAVDWDKNTNNLEIDSDIYDIETKTWLGGSPLSGFAEPSSWELYQEFLGMLAVYEDKKKGLVSVSIEFLSPQLASEWVDKFVVAINEHMRERKLRQVNRNIEYLEAQIEKTAIADMREVFYQIIEEQIKGKMLAEATPEYVFSTVNRAMLPEVKSKPKRAIICVLGTLLGGILATFFVLFRHFLLDSTVKH